MHRFYLPPESVRESSFNLSEAETHHAVNVLRVRVGERVVVLDGAGGELLCEACAVAGGQLGLKVAQRHALPPLPYQLTLMQAVTKGKTMDVIVQKATELGVHRIVPILSERTVAQLEAERASEKVGKWQATTIEAIKQCGSTWLPKVESPTTPKDFLSRGESFDLHLVASLQSDSRHPREHFDAFCAERGRLPKSIGIWVGPEGDFTPAEVNLIRSAGALPITLGQLILRSETAAIYCLSVLNYELQSPRRSRSS